MGIGGALLGLVLLSAGGGGPTDTYLVAGRVQVAHETSPALPSSHRFELTVSFRQGRFVSAELCVFASVAREDEGWEGSCFRPEPSHVELAFQPAAFSAPVGHTDAAAQKLLRFLMQESYRHLPGDRRVAGYDIDAPLSVRHEHFAEADL